MQTAKARLACVFRHSDKSTFDSPVGITHLEPQRSSISEARTAGHGAASSLSPSPRANHPPLFIVRMGSRMIWLVWISVASQIEGSDAGVLSQRAGGLLRPGERLCPTRGFTVASRCRLVRVLLRGNERKYKLAATRCAESFSYAGHLKCTRKTTRSHRMRCGFWLPQRDLTFVDVRLYGKKVLTIDHHDYSLNSPVAITQSF